MTEKRYFGTDGIRGRVGVAPISADFVLRLGRAAGRVLAPLAGDGSLLIGKDTRLSGYMFESALEAGLIAAGADVQLLGPMPTPAVAYLTRATGASAGIVISASHNPHHDNGIKFFSAQGEKLGDEIELAIEAELDAPFATVEPDALGKAQRMADAPQRYLDFVRASVPADFSLRGLTLVVDCANGANYQLAPQLLSTLGADVIPLAHAPDGLNINLDCGSMHPELAARHVRERGADLGIAFDGDGDRLVMIDHRGHVLDGDDLIFILACDWLARGRLVGPVVGTLMSNYGLELALRERGIAFRRARVGDRYVHQQLIEHGGILGGEASGHILCLDRAGTGDALLNALQVLHVLVQGGQSLEQLLAPLKRFPQRTINVRVARGVRPAEHPGVLATRAEIERELDGRGRVVLRASGTEPVVRVTIEADNEALVERLVTRLADAVRSAA